VKARAGAHAGPVAWLALLVLLATRAGAAAAQVSGDGDLDCLIEPHAVVEVASPVPGLLESVEVERSDVVEAGQVVARLEADVEEANVALARARAESLAEIESRRTNLEFVRRRLERLRELYDRNAIPFHEVDEVETEMHMAESELRKAEENRQLARLELRRVAAQLEMRTIRSPVRSVVVERLKSPGEYVENEPILELARIDPLKVEVIVPVALYGRIAPGMQAEVRPEAPIGGVHAASVSIVDRVVDAASGTFGVRLDLPNPDHALPGGLRCRVRFLP